MQILTKYKTGKIAPLALLTIIFISKVLTAFTTGTVLSKGVFAPDMAFSIVISYLLNLVLSFPLIYGLESGKSPLNLKSLSTAYGVYFAFLGAVIISRFSYFAATELNPDSNPMFYCMFIIAFCVYATGLGAEPISRFASLVFAICVLGILIIALLGINEFQLMNLFPFTQNSIGKIFINAINFSADPSEFVILYSLYNKINGNVKKTFYISQAMSYSVGLLMVLLVLGVLGNTANLSVFPMFKVSQVAKFSDNERLDSVYTAFWIFAVFLKSTVYMYGASQMIAKSFYKVSHKKGCVITGVSVLVLSLIFVQFNSLVKVYQIVMAVLYAVFYVVIPVACAAFQKKDKGAELIEKF